MEYDTNPGGFHNWFWFLPFEDEQLDEINRRDFLKGVGATAGLAAMGGLSANAQAQNIDYNAWANYAVDKAITALRKFKSVLISPQRINFEEVVKNAVTRSINWYMSSTNAYNLQKVIDEVTAIAYNAADREGIGISDLIGGELTDNVAVKATNTFARSYMAAVEQKVNEYKQTVGQQQQQQQTIEKELGTLTQTEYKALANGIALYITTKDDNDPSFKQISDAISKFIQTYNNKDQVNKMHKSIKELIDAFKAGDPPKFTEARKQLYRDKNEILNSLNQLTSKKQPEFKEEAIDKVASPDAVKRIEQLVQYK
jgi:hypothetical protein